MGNRFNTQGLGYRPALAGRRDLLQLLDQATQATASIRTVLYVKPLGNDLHQVRNQCNPQPYTVGVTVPGATFRAGAPVLLGSNGGGPGEVILGGAPPGRSGGANFPATEEVRAIGYNIPSPVPPEPPSFCPVAITGKEYLAVWVNKSTKQLVGWIYADGDYQSDAGPATSYNGLATIDVTSVFQPAQRCLQGADEYVIMRADANKIISWNVTDGTIAVLEPGASSSTFRVAGPVWPGSGSVYYFATVSKSGATVTIQMYTATFTATGTTWTAAGSPFVDSSSGYLTSSSSGNTLICTSTDLQVPLRKSFGGAIPYFDLVAETWSAGTGRLTFSDETPPVTGYPISGGRATLIDSSSFPFVASTIGPGPDPAGDGFGQIWAADPIGRLGFQSISPGGGEIAFYPLSASAGDGLFRCAVQLPGEYELGHDCLLSPLIAVEAGPSGQVPHYMLARD